jgi:hypothetical protein
MMDCKPLATPMVTDLKLYVELDLVWLILLYTSS